MAWIIQKNDSISTSQRETEGYLSSASLCYSLFNCKSVHAEWFPLPAPYSYLPALPISSGRSLSVPRSHRWPSSAVALEYHSCIGGLVNLQQMSRPSLASLAVIRWWRQGTGLPLFHFTRERRLRLFLRSRDNSIRETNAQPVTATGLFKGFGALLPGSHRCIYKKVGWK